MIVYSTYSDTMVTEANQAEAPADLQVDSSLLPQKVEAVTPPPDPLSVNQLTANAEVPLQPQNTTEIPVATDIPMTSLQPMGLPIQLPGNVSIQYINAETLEVSNTPPTQASKTKKDNSGEYSYNALSCCFKQLVSYHLSYYVACLVCQGKLCFHSFHCYSSVCSIICLLLAGYCYYTELTIPIRRVLLVKHVHPLISST